jgi:HK97 family phage major capsid protein
MRIRMTLPPASRNTLGATLYDSKFIKVSIRLLQDSVWNWATEIGALIGQRIARKQVVDVTNNLLSQSTLGATFASATAITVAEIQKLFHSVDKAYRDMPSCAWMLHDQLALYLENLVDGNGRSVLYSSLAGINDQGPVETLRRKQVIINNAMPSTVAASNKTVLIGAMDRFHIRDAGELQVIRCQERFIELQLYGFIGWLASDSVLQDAGEHPIVYGQQHS